MLRGIVEQEGISKEKLEARQAQIQEEASKRFFESASQKASSLETMTLKSPALKSRRRVLDDYDSIALERILGTSDLFPISYLQIGLNAG